MSDNFGVLSILFMLSVLSESVCKKRGSLFICKNQINVALASTMAENKTKANVFIIYEIKEAHYAVSEDICIFDKLFRSCMLVYQISPLCHCPPTLSSPQLNFFTLVEEADEGHSGGCGAGCTLGLGILDLKSLGMPPIAEAVGVLALSPNTGLDTFFGPLMTCGFSACRVASS